MIFWYIFANQVTVCVGLVAALHDTILSVNANSLENSTQRSEFLRRTDGISYRCVLFYQISIVGWFIVFGMFGFVKYSRISILPCVYAAAGVVVTFAVARKLHVNCEKAKAEGAFLSPCSLLVFPLSS